MIKLEFDSNKGWPTAKNYFYKCEECGESIPSQPNKPSRCQCGNLFIDNEAGRLSAKQDDKISLYKVE